MFKTGFEKIAARPRQLNMFRPDFGHNKLVPIKRLRQPEQKQLPLFKEKPAEPKPAARPKRPLVAYPHLDRASPGGLAAAKKPIEKKAALKPFSMSRGRITPTIGPFNAVKGLLGQTGVQGGTMPAAVKRFGPTKPRQALVARSNVRAGDHA